MFDFSFAEIFIVLVIALFLIGPEELPSTLKTIRNLIRNIKSMSRKILSDIIPDDDIESVKNDAIRINNDIKQIVDKEGNVYDAYNVEQIKSEIAEIKRSVK